jgi:hypothetical protein
MVAAAHVFRAASASSTTLSSRRAPRQPAAARDRTTTITETTHEQIITLLPTLLIGALALVMFGLGLSQLMLPAAG